MMHPRLQLVSSNPYRGLCCYRLDGQTLHRLADRLTAQVQAGNTQFAHVIAAIENLTPFGVAVVAMWMWRAGLSEQQILDVMV